MGRTGLLLAMALCAFPRPALARIGDPLPRAVAVAKAAHVPRATFAVRDGRVVLEIWRSYTGDDFRRGPAWSTATATRMRRTLAGADTPVREDEEKTSWASFPIWTFRYASGMRLVFVAREHAAKVWIMVAGTPWAWDTPYEGVEALCDGWTLLGGRLTRHAAGDRLKLVR